jgi:cell division protein FtsI/penicillin-binding protein 2
MKIDIRKQRLIALCVIASLAVLALVYRLVDIQLLHGKEYSDIAIKQSTGRMDIAAERGIIYDRTGRPLAINIIKNALFAQAADQKEIDNIYSYLDRLYGKPSGFSLRKYDLEVNKFQWIDRRLPDDLADRVQSDTIPGLYITKEQARDYPFPDVGRQLLGYTDIDGKGIAGVEYSFDSILAGYAGQLEYLRDGQRNTYRLREFPLIQPVPGNSIKLTLDWYLQEIVEQELKAGVIEHNALEGSAVFIDCATGEILAAADFINDGKNEAVKLHAISNVFEPGSVFKIFTVAGVLDAGLVNLNEKIYCENGAWRIGPRTLHDDHGQGWLTPQEIIEKSSNIGTAKMALRLGGKSLYDTAHKFGFGMRYFIGLPGEASGSVSKPVSGKKNDEWSAFNTSALAMGHSVSVTALQLAAGIAAVANGGNLLRPALIKSISDCSGNIVKKSSIDAISHVIKPESSSLLRQFMRGVVERGTAQRVKSDIVAIAGKTGTAEVADLVHGGYKKNKFVASFLGFFPYENPKIAGVIVLHEPEPIHYGGFTAGPIFKNIAEKYTLANSEKLKPPKKLFADNKNITLEGAPDFVGCEISLAMESAAHNGISLIGNSEKGIIVWQYPPAGKKVPGNNKIAVVIKDDSLSMPILSNLTGLNVRTAMAMLDYHGIVFEIEGSGIVQNQEPPPGTIIDSVIKCRLICSNELINEDSTEELD